MAVGLLILASIVISVSMILLNKTIMSNYHFGFPTILTCYHFFLTWIVLTVMAKMGLFSKAKDVTELAKWSMGLFGVISIVAMNMNLKMNSIGFYQLSKLCTIPCMIVYKYFFQKQSTPVNTLCSLTILLVGLCLFTVNDVEFNLLGSLVAVVAVVTTVIYQTQTSVLQKTYQCDGTQLNQAVAFPRFVVSAIAAVMLETRGELSVFNHEFRVTEVFMILFTGFLAVMGNTVGFSLIGKAGPITFQVVGHVKTILIFILGLALFPPVEEPREKKIKKICGLIVSMSGVCLYTYFEIKNKELAERLKRLEEEEHVDPPMELQNSGVTFQDAQQEQDE